MEYHEVAHPVSVLIARLFCLVWRAADTVRPNGFDLTVDRYLKLIAHSQRDRSAGLRCQILDKAGVVSLLGDTGVITAEKYGQSLVVGQGWLPFQVGADIGIALGGQLVAGCLVLFPNPHSLERQCDSTQSCVALRPTLLGGISGSFFSVAVSNEARITSKKPRS